MSRQEQLTARPSDQPPVRRARRALRIVLRVAIALVLAVLAAIAALLVALDTEAGRTRVCAEVEALVRQEIRGRLTIGRCAVLTMGHVRVEEVALRDAAGRVVLTIGAVSVRPDLGAAMRGAIRIREVVIARPSV